VGCATRPPLLPADATPLELTDTAFFAQRAYHCGPAALATVLHAAEVRAQPDDLAEQVYLPARQGSLQVELQAAVRRAGRIPYLIDADLDALRAELAAGRPVLVLQNLGLGVLPVWHYAVVIGLEPAGDAVILRSGTERRLVMPAHRFLHSWRLADGWALVVLRPGELPAGAERDRYLAAVARAERQLDPAARRAAYQAALLRWPDSVIARFGLAHAQHAAGDLQGAEADYRRLLAQRPRHAAAYNNLAEVLKDRGCHAQARAAAGKALELAHGHAALHEAVLETLGQIPAGDDGPGCSSAGPQGSG
jgi:tetratricopeptide (TPR) repeat protein